WRALNDDDDVVVKPRLDSSEIKIQCKVSLACLAKGGVSQVMD
nr:hypothetical protein [Tanacetum cinerariifolium]